MTKIIFYDTKFIFIFQITFVQNNSLIYNFCGILFYEKILSKCFTFICNVFIIVRVPLESPNTSHCQNYVNVLTGNLVPSEKYPFGSY